MSESIILPIYSHLEAMDDLNGEPIELCILRKIEEADPAAARCWINPGNEDRQGPILKAIRQALTVPDGETLEFEYSLDDIIKAAKEQNVDDDLLRDILDDTGDDYIEDEYNDRQLAPKITLDSFNNYEFKRYICDLMEVGYQTDSLTLISTLIDKIDPTWRLIL